MPGTFGSIIIGVFGTLAWLLALLVGYSRVRLLTRGVRIAVCARALVHAATARARVRP